MTSSRLGRLDWRFVLTTLQRLLVPLLFAWVLLVRLKLGIDRPEALFQDSGLYYRATEAWVHGGDPWLVRNDVGTLFAAPPPALLINLPLLPFGERAASFFWPIAGILGMVLAIRHYRLPWWWLAFPPLAEGFLAGSPDVALLALMVLGGGSVTALVKPYAIPGMLAEARWRAILGAIGLGLVTLPVLPWEKFLADWPWISEVLKAQELSGPLPGPIAFVVLMATLSLGRLGVGAATPALWPNTQPHYGLFSLQSARSSPLIAVALCFPGPVAISIALLALAGLGAWRRRPAGGLPSGTGPNRTDTRPPDHVPIDELATAPE